MLAAPSRVTQYIGLDFASGADPLPGAGNADVGNPARAQTGWGAFFTVPFLWPLHDVPHDEYRFTPFALRRHLCNAGFDGIQISALGGWDASLAQMIGLWIRRRPMGKTTRSILSRLAVPIVRYLVGRDRPPINFGRNTMLTGLGGTATKGNTP